MYTLLQPAVPQKMRPALTQDREGRACGRQSLEAAPGHAQRDALADVQDLVSLHAHAVVRLPRGLVAQRLIHLRKSQDCKTSYCFCLLSASFMLRLMMSGWTAR